jgi:pyruvate formate lyase activating enzyme
MLDVARLSRPLHQQFVQCMACEHWCAIAPGATGRCGVRRNVCGELHLLVYGRSIATNIDPIEKKPLNHFLPGNRIFSIGTLGCNLHCAWCQNWEISQAMVSDPAIEALGDEWSPRDIVENCIRRGISLIAFTYNEPAIYLEYAYATARLAHGSGIRTVLVTSGFETLAALQLIGPYTDAANIDLKAFSEETYRRYCGARLAPVLRNIQYLVQETEIWTEVTTLIVPGINDSDAELTSIAEFLAGISPDLPWHVSGFTPQYQMTDRPPTPAATLRRAWEIGRRTGLRFVYTGNIWQAEELTGCSDTVCPTCHTTLVERSGYRVHVYWQQPGVCPSCGERIEGRWV